MARLIYEVVRTQEVTIVSEETQKTILAVKVSYSEDDFSSETTFEFPNTVSDEDIEQKIIDYGTELKQQVVDRNFNKSGTI